MNNSHELSQEQFEKIEAYLLGELSEEELAAFEAEAKSDPMLEAEIARQRQLQEAVEIGAMKEQLDSFHENTQKVSAPKKSTFRWWAVAAVFVGLLATAYFLFFSKSESEKLYARYHSIDPGLPTPMSATDNYVFYDAMVDYKNEKYKLSIEKWETLLNENPKNDTLNYYLGSAHFADKEHRKAQPYFSTVSQFNESVFHEKAEWYLALTFLSLEEFEKLDSLSGVASGKHSDKIREINVQIQQR